MSPGRFSVRSVADLEYVPSGVEGSHYRAWQGSRALEVHGYDREACAAAPRNASASSTLSGDMARPSMMSSASPVHGRRCSTSSALPAAVCSTAAGAMPMRWKCAAAAGICW